MFPETRRLQRRTRQQNMSVNLASHQHFSVLPPPTSMERASHSPSPLVRVFISTFSAIVTFFLLMTLLKSGPGHFTRVPFGGTHGEIPMHRVPDPLYYDNEPYPSNWQYRANAVKKAFLHAYNAYEANAFPADELWPLSNKGRQNFNAWGVSVIDAMDTMLLMGLKAEFRRALVHVSNMEFNVLEGHHAHFFETTIRYLGGLLSAYALSGEPVLLKKADELGRKMLPAFYTPSGLPTYGVNPQTGKGYGGPRPPRVLLAEMASCQLEYRYLAHLTGRSEYYRAADRVNSVLQISQNLRHDAMWATHWETENGTQTNDHFSVGAWGDSAYEYILKQYIQTSRSETRFKRMYMRFTHGILEELLYLSPSRNLLYVTDKEFGTPSRKLEHLSCFYPGLLALGVHILKNDTPIAAHDVAMHRWAAEGLAHTCWTLYGESPSGLAPEEAQFEPHVVSDVSKKMSNNGHWMTRVWDWQADGSPGGKPPGVGHLSDLITNASRTTRDYATLTGQYYLRPETIESIYLMWKTTGDEIWRERGWFIFKAIEKNCRLHSGYASIHSVDISDPHTIINKLDDMPSYALAETWKYLFLMFTDKDPVPLDKWVFNTEAHPLPIFDWSETERKEFGIR